MYLSNRSFSIETIILNIKIFMAVSLSQLIISSVGTKDKFKYYIFFSAIFFFFFNAMF